MHALRGIYSFCHSSRAPLDFPNGRERDTPRRYPVQHDLMLRVKARVRDVKDVAIA